MNTPTSPLLTTCLLIAILSVPLILRMVPPNGLYGFRTPRTRSSPDIWYSANAFAGWALLVAAVVSATIVMTLPPDAGRWVTVVSLAGPLVVALAASFAYLARL